jgi:3-methylfumaryl-CoA hydratase
MTGMDIAHWRQWVGREEETTDLVTPRLVRGLLATLDRDDDAVPAAIQWCLAPAMALQSRLGPDGHAARGEFLPPVSLPRRMWAGGALEFFDPLRVGDQVTRRSRIADVQAKEGRTGALCFVTVEHDYATARGPAIKERQDIVYRAAETAPGNAGSPPEPARQDPRWRRALTADATMLFRYSALTFNGHRIHYDRAYCQEVEHYPGLVVHGPLQATLLIEHAAAARGRTPRRFDFRAVRPLFDGAEFSLNAVADGDALSLWIADRDGRATMTATARWE